MKSIAILFLLISISTTAVNAQYESNWKSIDSRAVPSWFEDAKFGIFIHWGIYSVPAWGPTHDVELYAKYSEWYWKRLTDVDAEGHKQFKAFHDSRYGEKFTYQDFVPMFTAELFEPDEWARIFEQSGARYVVLTSKHHDGFAMWPSVHAWNWNVKDVGPHRDVAGDLTTAVRARNLKMGFYYSLYEWFNPLYLENKDTYVKAHMIPQLKDLVTSYRPDILWTDGEWDLPSEKWRSTEFLAWLYNESPVKQNVVVNDRWGKETRGLHGGIFTTEYDMVHDESSIGKKINRPWEECRGIGTSFGYNRNEYLENYSNSQELIHILIDKVARGGNLLLNVGPTADGRIPVIMQQRLKDIGDWLEVNGESIYQTRAWEKAPVPQKGAKVFYTKKGKDLYIICTKWPEGEIKLDGIHSPKKISMLGYPGQVSWNFKKGSLSIDPPAVNPATFPCHHAWVFKLQDAL